MYTKSARYYDALYSFKDYKVASDKLRELLRRIHPNAKSLLEVACGTGKFIENLRSSYDVEGLDINAELLAIAQERCPGIALHSGDMADFTLDRGFDVVACLFSSIAYVRTLTRMRATVAAMAKHLNPGGVLVVEPWFPPERLWTGLITANHVDEPELKISWMYTTEREGDCAVLDIHYLVGTPQAIEHFSERHELGLFTDEEHRDSFARVGMSAEYDAEGLFGRGMYWGIAAAPDTAGKPAAQRAAGAR